MAKAAWHAAYTHPPSEAQTGKIVRARLLHRRSGPACVFPIGFFDAPIQIQQWQEKGITRHNGLPHQGLSDYPRFQLVYRSQGHASLLQPPHPSFGRRHRKRAAGERTPPHPAHPQTILSATFTLAGEHEGRGGEGRQTTKIITSDMVGTLTYRSPSWRRFPHPGDSRTAYTHTNTLNLPLQCDIFHIKEPSIATSIRVPDRRKVCSQHVQSSRPSPSEYVHPSSSSSSRKVNSKAPRAPPKIYNHATGQTKSPRVQAATTCIFPNHPSAPLLTTRTDSRR